MVSNNLLYQVALTLVPQIGPIQAKILLQHLDATALFKTKKSSLERIEGIGSIRAEAIRSFSDFNAAEQEIKFIEKNGIKPLFITDEEYPKRLLHCCDSPTLLYYKGSADLNDSKVIAIIGTRNHTEYGKQVTEKLIKDLAEIKPLIISGLAFGIDAIAHRCAIKNGLSTVGILAHGLNTLYPYEHISLAKDMIKEGGLLTEFNSRSKPDKHNFPIRNRVVAGMSDATIVIETGIKGGSLITAELANGYNKDVFAFPGRSSDNKSAGCNQLIRNNKAILLTEAKELIELMGWEEKVRSRESVVNSQKQLFIELSSEERIVVDILKVKDAVHIDEINMKSGMSSSAVAAAILNLELQAVIFCKPGKMYCLA